MLQSDQRDNLLREKETQPGRCRFLAFPHQTEGIIMGKALQESYPSTSSSRFTVGRDVRGQWVVCDRLGLVGGLFADRASAVHFALVESDHCPGAVSCAGEGEILHFSVVFEAPPTARPSLSSRA